MTPAKVVQRMAEMTFVSGFVGLLALRITPLSWFPWDVAVTVALLVVGAVLIAVRKRIWPQYDREGKPDTV